MNANDLTVDALTQALQEFYAADNRHISHVMPLASGFEADIYAFSLTEREERQDLVLRLYAEGCSEKAAREFGAMRRLREAGYAVPRVLTLHEETGRLSRPFLVMERIDGVSLDARYWTAGTEAKPSLQATLYRLMAELHSLPGAAILPDSPLAASQHPYDFLDSELAILHELRLRLEGRDPASVRAALDWLTARRELAPCARLVVVHGDFHRNNVLIDANERPFVIDWSNVRLADCRTELAWTRLITRWVLPESVRPAESESELPLYEQLTGHKVVMLDYFEVIAALRMLLSILVSLRHGVARQGLRPGAEALMRRDAECALRASALLQAHSGLPMPDLDDALSVLFA